MMPARWSRSFSASRAPTPRHRSRRAIARSAACALAALLVCSAAPAHAQLFHLYLKCKGKVAAGRGTMDAQLDLAMRDNNLTALVQSSNVLPVGERMRYVPTQQAYTMTFHAPARTVAIYHGWWAGALFAWYPPLDKLSVIRLSIDRQTGDLSGQLLNFQQDVLGTLAMQCTPSKDEDQPEPKF